MRWQCRHLFPPCNRVLLLCLSTYSIQTPSKRGAKVVPLDMCVLARGLGRGESVTGIDDKCDRVQYMRRSFGVLDGEAAATLAEAICKRSVAPPNLKIRLPMWMTRDSCSMYVPNLDLAV